jgi:serine/threonine protein kinase
MGDAAHAPTESGFRGNARFELTGRLGKGGMGIVYRVLDRERGVRMALKGLQAPAADDILRFKTEFRALRDLDHPNLLRLGELFEEDGRWFFTMELVEGTDFLDYVRASSARDDEPTTGSLPGVTRSRAQRVRERATRHRSARESRPSDSPGDDALHGGPVVYDEGRLRAALAQLTLALDTLHRAGMVHRDVKPSNVLVEPAGRVVLLDFGVIAELGESTIDEKGAVIGTATYMAPEQASGLEPRPAADWYAVGTMLYQVLTGRLPFEGASALILKSKVVADAPAPSSIVGGVPADLDALCTRMLARDPEARPSAIEILRALGVPDPEAMLAPSRAGTGSPFIGRVGELEVIAEAFAQARDGDAVNVVVEGPSGIGKSAMVARAIEAIRADRPDTLVLRGRCHENETVPYNAFDGVVDDLSRALRHASHGELLAVPRAAALLRLFPTLGSVGFLGQRAAAEEKAELAPVELRQHAFDALRELVANVANQRPTVVVLEDVHWADAESLGLLEEWTRPPSPAVLLVATARPAPDGGACAAVHAIRGDVRAVALEGLPDDDARALVERLAVERDADLDVTSIVREAGGHPMFLGELLQFSREHRGEGRVIIQLDDALLARVDRMPELARRALEVVAVAGLPIREGVVARALKAPRTELAPQLSVLRSARLLRSTGARQGNALEPFHDRVREAVYGRLTADRRKTLHRRLGLLLEREKAPEEVLVNHFDKSGDVERAITHALAASKAAAHGLAFERAATLLGYVIRAGLSDPERERALRTSVGEMLQKAGRPGDAAAAFAAAAMTGSPPAIEAFELRRRVAEQYLMGGYLDQGLDAARVLLAQLGEWRPNRYWLILLVAIWHLVLLKFARLDWSSRSAQSIAPEVQRRLDVYWSLGAGLAFLDPMRAATFSSKGFLLCLRSGDDVRIARQACAACIGISGRGDPELAKRLLVAAREAARRAGTDQARFYADLSDVGYTFMIRNDCRKTLAKCERARAQWSKIGQRGGWESDVTEQFELWALAVLGDVRRLVDAVAEGIRFARGTGNRFRELMLRASFPQAYMLRDAALEGDADVRDALRESGGGSFATPEYWALKSRSMLALYEGREEPLAALEAEWRRFDRSALGALELLAMESSDIRASLAIRRANHAKAAGDAAAVTAHLARAHRFLKRVKRSPLPFAVANYMRLQAAYVLVARGAAEARPLFEQCLPIVEREGWEGQVAALRYTLGRIVDGPEGAAHRAAASAWVARLEPRSPEKLMQTIAVGIAPTDR